MRGGGAEVGHAFGFPGAPGEAPVALNWIAMLGARPQGAGLGGGVLAVVAAGGLPGADGAGFPPGLGVAVGGLVEHEPEVDAPPP